MTSPFTSVPVVDVAPLLEGSPAQVAEAASQLGRAATDVGFLHVTGHGIPAARFDDLLAAAQQLFAQPLQDKMRHYIGESSCHRGYVPEGEEVFGVGTRDRKEAFDVGLDLPADHPAAATSPLLGPNAWPDIVGFAAAVTAWYDEVLRLGHALARGFALALGQPADALTRHVTTPPSQLRLIHYPFDGLAQDAVGIGAHTDYELFTLLRSTAPGLEVLNSAGAWVDVPPQQDAFVINVGDLLETWSGGRYVATTHRVRRVSEQRWSFPLFYTLDHATAVRPYDDPAAPGLVAGDHLFAQTAQTFRYLRDRIARGELVLPGKARAIDSFGRAARSGADA